MADGRFGSARNAGEESPNTTRQHAAENTRAFARKREATESVTENKPPRFGEVEGKRRGKSPPPVAQATGHDKPLAVQDKTGSQPPGSFRASGADFRVLVAAQQGCSGANLPGQDK